MTDLAAFLRARLDEDEAAARHPLVGVWKKERAERWELRDLSATEGTRCYHEGYADALDACVHAVEVRDPARVLREVEAKRRRLARHVPMSGLNGQYCAWCSTDTATPHDLDVPWPCPDVRDDLAVYSDHPDYDPAWAPQQ